MRSSRICWLTIPHFGELPDFFAAAYVRGRRWALDETGLLDLPEASPLTVEQALGDPLTDD